jgi:hypothetical protein
MASSYVKLRINLLINLKVTYYISKKNTILNVILHELTILLFAQCDRIENSRISRKVWLKFALYLVVQQSTIEHRLQNQ